MMPGLIARTAASSSDSPAIEAGRTLDMKMSAPATRRRNAACAAGAFRSMHRLRLLRLSCRNTWPMPGCRVGSVLRNGSPAGGSTLITSAP